MEPTGRHPRARVLHEAWSRLSGVETWTGPHGAPLSRVTKLVLIPLVLRPMSNPLVAGDLLDDTGTALVHTLVAEAGRPLAAASTWYDVLKAARRRLGISGGNPQDRYLQRCFELAVLHGPPQPDSAAELAEEVLRESESQDAGRTVTELHRLLADPTTRARIRGELDRTWRARPTTPYGDLSAPGWTEALDALVESPAAGAALASLRDSGAAAAAGRRLWTGDAAGSVPALAALADVLPAREPALGDGVRTADLPAPLDRSVHQRTFSVLRATSAREELAEVGELVADEVQRSCAPLGLLDEDTRVTLALGALASAALAGDGSTAVHRALRRRWERERIVARSRRMTESVAGTGDAPRAYVHRLWARLHGREVRGAGVLDAGETWDLLEGVCRSVVLDQRERVRRRLRAAGQDPAPAGAGPGATDRTGVGA